MKWQDQVLGAGSILFFIALLPSLFSAKKPHWASSLMTGSVLGAYTIVDITLDLPFAAITNTFTAGAWLVLFVQRVRKDLRGTEDD